MRDQVEIQADFSDLAKFIGSAEGWSETVATPYYMSDLLRSAHGIAAKAFDAETAAVATAGNGLGHMYEWGTAGINPAKDTPTLNPTSRAAKLWAHKLDGNGMNRKIDFVFRPSVVPVPLPVDTGTANEVQKPKHRFTFAARPWITEYGVPVVIKPKYSKVLFIPHYGMDGGVDERANIRGYTITPYAVTVTPGATNAGNFTRHWYAWWNSEGAAVIDETATKIVDGEMAAVIYSGTGAGRALRAYKGGVKSKTFTLQVADALAQAKAKMKAEEGTSSRARYLNEDLSDNLAALNGEAI